MIPIRKYTHAIIGTIRKYTHAIIGTIRKYTDVIIWGLVAIVAYAAIKKDIYFITFPETTPEYGLAIVAGVTGVLALLFVDALRDLAHSVLA